ncbi:MAG: hypothetical protein Q7W05_14105 [Deltaproteobacteria bacterium]|nr:hypothetical protein [Deltaproteobacteria bacterium]
MNESNKRVIILGSGASRASKFALPTMSGFFGPIPSRYRPLFAFLKWFYPGLSKSEYNLEEVLAFVDLSRVRLPLWGEDRRAHTYRYEQIYALILDYIHDRLQLPYGESCALHERMVSRLDPLDSIITVNYDLVCDQALLKIEPGENDRPNQYSRIGKLPGLLHEQNLYGGFQPPGLMLRETINGFYLKLHGSLDWIQCPTLNCRANMNIFSTNLSTLASGQRAGQPCRFCGASLRTMIVPPVASKRLEDRGRLAFLWNMALREIRKATEVVVIGLSLAPTDLEVRWLLREGLDLRQRPVPRKQITIVNPSEKDVAQVVKCIPDGKYEIRMYDSMTAYVDSMALGFIHDVSGPDGEQKG